MGDAGAADGAAEAEAPHSTAYGKGAAGEPTNQARRSPSPRAAAEVTSQTAIRAAGAPDAEDLAASQAPIVRRRRTVAT